MSTVNLPISSNLPVENLVACFNNVTNSYKFYWFLALLDHIRENQSSIASLDSLIARMVANVWYPTNYFRLSFGKQDRLSQVALLIKDAQSMTLEATLQNIIDAVIAEVSYSSDLSKQIISLGRYVPYRFLRPFFVSELKGIPDWKVEKSVAKFANIAFNEPNNPGLYRFSGDRDAIIEIHPLWFDYLQKHLAIVQGFCLWHLLKYLQKNNPNVPNVAGKLFAPEQRDLSQCRKFWRLAFKQLGTINCIYSGTSMERSAFSLDHFLPWSFVSHDLLWNIIPTPKYVNSAKKDNLPDISLYFAAFARLQYSALQAIAGQRTGKLLEDYVLLFHKGGTEEICQMKFYEFRQGLEDSIVPQLQIARNIGFSANWCYTA